MTGLMNRMVQRARGTMPGVEPLVRTDQTAAAALGPSTETLSAAASRIAEMASQVKSAPTEFSPIAPPRRKDSNHIGETLSQRDTDDSTLPTTAWTDQENAADPAPRRDELQRLARTEAVLPAPSAARPLGEPITLEAREVKQALSEVNADTNAGSAPSMSLPTSVRRREPEQQPANMPGRADYLPVGPLDSATEHTEIHITIGSIELRAARAEPQQKPTPFKPRVTLGDYLGRSSGAGS